MISVFEPVIRAAHPTDREQLSQIPSAFPFLQNDFFVALLGAGVAAFLAWMRVSESDCEILRIETMPEFRRRGLARALLRRLREQACSDLFLEVRPSNVAAIHLYESEGFTLVGARRNYYSFPTEDALVLRFHPC